MLDFKDDVFGLDPELVHNATLILASTPQTLEHMLAHYGVTKDKGHVLYNGACGSFFTQPKPDPTRYRFIYSGSIWPGTCPQYIALAAQKLLKQYSRQARRFSIEFFGPKSYYYYLRLMPVLKPPAIAFKGYVDFQRLCSELSTAHAGIVTASRKIGFCIPSKLFTYVGAGLPILSYGEKNGALHRFVQDHEIGLHSTPGDLEALAGNMRRLIEDKDLIATFRRNAANLAAQYTMESQVRNLIDRLGALGPHA